MLFKVSNPLTMPILGTLMISRSSAFQMSRSNSILLGE